MPATANPPSPSTTKTSARVTPFEVEADAPRNADVLVQSIPGLRLRGAVNASKPVVANPQATDDEDEMMPIPEDQSFLGALPALPGQRLWVDPAKGTYRVTDPMHGDEKLLKRLVASSRAKGRPLPTGLRGMPEKKGKLSPDRMKTLCEELVFMEAHEMVRLTDGKLPTQDEIDSLRGEVLLNPGSRVHNNQPKYRKDYEEWQHNLSETGG